MKPITIFSWGYKGWGNATKQLIKAVDAVEKSRDFEPPTFVDIRIRRSVRAKGFREGTFENLLGKDRYRWIKRLGNESIINKANRMRIADPSAATELLDFAVASSMQKHRIIFFCSCPFPRWDGKTNCHRSEVARLVLNLANKRGIPIEIVEWPGGTLMEKQLPVSAEVFRQIKNGRVTIPLKRDIKLAEMAGLPWGSIVNLKSDGGSLRRLSGPAVYHNGQWSSVSLPPPGKTTATSHVRQSEIASRNRHHRI
jgi:hypothetical protein